MCGLAISAFVLSLVGALAQRGLAAALGVPARLVLGIGPRLGDRDAPPRAVEVRPAIVWSWVPLAEGGSRAARIAVRAIGPIAIVLVPYLVIVGAILADRGSEGSGAAIAGEDAPPRSVGVGEAFASAARVVAARVRSITGLSPSDSSPEPPGPVAMAREAARPIDGATRVALIAASWTALALLWSIVAALSEIARAARGRS